MSTEALRQSEPQFRALIEHSTDAIALLARDGAILYASPSTEQVTGYLAEEVVGVDSLSFVHPDDLEDVQRQFASILDQPGAFTSMKFRFHHKDGSYRWMDATATDWLEHATISAIVINYRDVTERKQQEDALRASEERYRTIVQTANEGIWLIDEQARTLYANKRMAELLNVTLEELEAHAVPDFLFPEDEATGKARILSNLQGHSEQFEFRFRRADGSELHTLAATSPVRDASGQIVGALGMFTNITVRKLTEHALSRSEEVLRIALNNSPITVYQQDRDLRYTWIYNPLSAFTSESILGKMDADFVSAEEAAHLTALKQRALLHGESVQEEIRTTSNAGTRWASLTVEPLRNSSGAIIGVTGAAIDLTERKELEQRTRSALESLLEMAQVLVREAEQDVSPDQPSTERIRPVMQRLAELTRAVLGCQRLSFTRVEPETELLRPLAVVGLSPEQEQRWWREQAEQEAHLSDSPDVALVARLRANEILLVDLTQPPYSAQPNPYGVRQMLVAPMVFSSQLLGFLSLDYGGLDHAYTYEELALARAVTELAALVMEREWLLAEHAQAQADTLAWRAAHQRMVELIELAHDAIIIRDPHSRIVYWNSGAERLYGWSKQEATGQDTHTLLLTRFLVSRETVNRVLAEAGQWEGVLTHTSRDGSAVIVESRQVLMRNQAGEPEAILEINRDITARERIQEEREEARANELAAREATRRMNEFIGIASHELKTPLTSIKGNLQLSRRRIASAIAETPVDNQRLLSRLADIQLMLDRAIRQVDVQNRLVSDLVDVSRIQTGQLELHLARIDLTSIVREMVENQRIAAPKRAISFEAETLAVPVLADDERIGQVVSNYLSNALKYSPPTCPVLVKLEADGELARVLVRDEGPGLTPEQQTHIWERFYRVPEIEVQSGSGVGLGLGLHICRTIIEQHGGQVGVESSIGKGATFWFTLPLHVEC